MGKHAVTPLSRNVTYQTDNGAPYVAPPENTIFASLPEGATPVHPHAAARPSVPLTRDEETGENLYPMDEPEFTPNDRNEDGTEPEVDWGDYEPAYQDKEQYSTPTVPVLTSGRIAIDHPSMQQVPRLLPGSVHVDQLSTAIGFTLPDDENTIVPVGSLITRNGDGTVNVVPPLAGGLPGPDVVTSTYNIPTTENYFSEASDEPFISIERTRTMGDYTETIRISGSASHLVDVVEAVLDA